MYSLFPSSSDYIEMAIAKRNTVTRRFVFDILTPSGPCEALPLRGEFPYRLTPRRPFNTNPPILFAGNRTAALNLHPPYCIAFTVSLPTENLGTLFAAGEAPFDGPMVTSLRISSNRVVFESGGQSVIFNTPDGAESFRGSYSGGYVHLQLCVATDNQAQLYTNCSNQPLTQSFVSSQRLDNARIVFFQNETTSGGGFFGVCNN